MLATAVAFVAVRYRSGLLDSARLRNMVFGLLAISLRPIRRPLRWHR
jgi:hypothetical protein